MSEQFTPNFYASNEGAPYPFTNASDAFSRPFVDAQVSVPSGYADVDVALKSWDPAGQFEIRAGDAIIIPLGTPVAVTAFGAYVIWEARTDQASATLVFVAEAPPPALPSGSYVFQERAVTRGSARELYIVADGVEVAGPGGTLRLSSGPHVNLATELSATGDGTVEINANFDTSAGCEQADIQRTGGLVTINGIPPDANGNFSFIGKQTYLVERRLGSAGLFTVNIGEPCCDCPDYVAMFGSMQGVSVDFNAIALELLKAQDGYRQLLSYTRFILQAPIVGGISPGDTDRIAEAQ